VILAVALAVVIIGASTVRGDAHSPVWQAVSREERSAPGLIVEPVWPSSIAVDRVVQPTSVGHPERTRARVAAAEALDVRPTAQRPVVRPARAPNLVRDHLWIPSLHISRHVGFYACGRTSALANRVYSWGCAGQNNTYLLGHAWGVFKALHDTYVSGRLRKGLVAYYADHLGRITRFQVTGWQVVPPGNAAWAMAAQPTPSMTLQTCVGPHSKYRLDVRLVSF